MEGDDWMDDLVDKFWDISIHSLRMEGDLFCYYAYCVMVISIHSLRMEGDFILRLESCGYYLISIHSLRMEGDA